MAVLILLGVLLVSSQVMTDCEVKPTTQDFDISRFMGKWYFIKEANTMWHSSSDYKCNHLDFTLLPSGEFQSDFTIYNKSAGAYKTFTRTIRKDDPNSSEGRLRVFKQGLSGGTMYNVQETDYDHYAVIWMCRDNAETGQVKEMPYGLARSRTPSHAILSKFHDKLARGSSFEYVTSDQSDCPARE